MNDLINVDLHSHTKYSDGLLTPSELISRAEANGVDVLSITDHDTLKAYPEALEVAKDLNIKLVSGCEISTSWNDLPYIHVLVYDFDIKNSVLTNAIEEMQQYRYNIALQTNKKLIEAGLPDILDEVLESVDNNFNMLFRTSFARVLAKKGICENVDKAKEEYFKPNCPGWVDASFPSIPEVVKWAKQSNAKTVLAHPGQYNLSTDTDTELLDYFKLEGGDAIEISTGSHTKEQYRYYQQYCTKNNFLVSRGSDFHSEDYKGTDLGKGQVIESENKAIWKMFNNYL